MSTGQVIMVAAGEIAFETRDFYLACYLRCTGYDLIDLRAEGRRKVFVFRDRPTRRKDVMAFYGDGAAVPPLAFSSTIKGHEGAAAQCVTNRHTMTPRSPAGRNSARHLTGSCKWSSTGSVTVTSDARFRAPSARATSVKSSLRPARATSSRFRRKNCHADAASIAVIPAMGAPQMQITGIVTLSK